ncbi:MAG: hypothetical protein AAGH60_03970 [Pseudomonadota bacterium]
MNGFEDFKLTLFILVFGAVFVFGFLSLRATERDIKKRKESEALEAKRARETE